MQIQLDGAPALGLLFLQVEGVQVMSLCYLDRSRRCPLVQRELSPAEIETIAPVSRNQLKSDIHLESPQAARPSESKGRINDEVAELQQRHGFLIEETKSAIIRSVELREEAARTIRTCQEVGEKLRRASRTPVVADHLRRSKEREGMRNSR
ncbi:MAG: hypothetical protein JWR15_1640 [Prosthecobacter sp.]|nr:hypothetical protein [Prosthecobacter sp.]